LPHPVDYMMTQTDVIVSSKIDIFAPRVVFRHFFSFSSKMKSFVNKLDCVMTQAGVIVCSDCKDSSSRPTVTTQLLTVLVSLLPTVISVRHGRHVCGADTGPACQSLDGAFNANPNPTVKLKHLHSGSRALTAHQNLTRKTLNNHFKHSRDRVGCEEGL